ncbi:hypothetical protein HZB02_06780 [Candidatus Woesearchaeota archaeon]|nr:hypothetical protein [Candidatus Woesearchaeota archaeon]
MTKRTSESRKTKATPAVQASLYVYLEDPSVVRRNLLLHSKETLQYLQRYEDLKEYRLAKMELLAALSKKLHEIGTEVGALKRLMPTIAHHHVQRMAGESEGTITPQQPPLQQQLPRASQKKGKGKQQMNDLTLLEKQLAEVEQRMSRLGA